MFLRAEEGKAPGTRADEEQGTQGGIPPALAHHLVLQVRLRRGQNLLEARKGLGEEWRRTLNPKLTPKPLEKREGEDIS